MIDVPLAWELGSVDEIVAPEKGSCVTGPFGSSIGKKYWVDDGVPVIRGNNLTLDGGKFIDDGFVFISEEYAEKLNRYSAVTDDIVFTAAGTLGQVGIIPQMTKYPRYIISNKQMRLRVDKEKVDPRFAFFWFRSPIMQDIIIRRNTGSSVPLINLGILRSLPFPRMPLLIQRRIANILGALDDKIECNRRINQKLEAMADAFFKHWFLDLDNGWESKPLDEVATFLNGLALQKYPPKDGVSLPVIKIAELHRGVTESSDRASADIPSQYIVEDGDVLFSWSGSLEVCVWCNGRGALNQHLFKVTSADYPKWFYYQWVKHHLPEFRAIAAGKATTMGHIQREHLHQALVVVPPSETLQMMTDKCNHCLTKLSAIIWNLVHSLARATICSPSCCRVKSTLGRGIAVVGAKHF